MRYDTPTMTFAVVETGGKQYKVAKGDVVSIEKLPGELKEGDKITFDNVLLVDDGKDTKIGDPYLKGSKVEGTLEEQGRGKKLHVIRYRAKSRHFRKIGHRQDYMKVKISKIS